VLRFLGSTYVTDATITDVEPGRSLAYEAGGEGTTVRGYWRVEETPGGSRLVEGLEIELSGPMRLLEPLLARLYARRMRSEVTRPQDPAREERPVGETLRRRETVGVKKKGVDRGDERERRCHEPDGGIKETRRGAEHRHRKYQECSPHSSAPLCRTRGWCHSKSVRSGRGKLPDVHVGRVHLPHAVEAHDLRYGLLEVFLRGRGAGKLHDAVLGGADLEIRLGD
jgi:hypothetical protein